MTGVLVPLGGPERLLPRVNWGRWIVDCPVCSSALLVERNARELGGWVYDAAGRRLRYGAGCWDCGAQAALVWPERSFCDGVERLLQLRPDPSTRNWVWPETLLDLAAENALHGVFDHPALDGGGPRTLLALDEHGITLDGLPRVRRPFRQIGA